jgi:hypothetical protein
MKRLLLGLTVLVLTSACGFERSSNALAPAPASTAPTASLGSFLGTWTSQSQVSTTAVSVAPSSCSGFQWAINSQTATTVGGTFSAQCAGGITVSGTASGQLVSSSSMTVSATGAASGAGISNCSFALAGTATLIDNATALQIPYTGTTCLGPVQGTETLRKATPQAPTPAPTPTPTPVPTPAPPVVSAGGDAIDLTQVAVYNSPADIAQWPVTATITRLDMSPSAGLSFEFTTKNSWPDYTPPGWDGSLQYTVWAVVRVNGRWYTSGYIQMWRGRASTGAPILSDFARNWAYDARWGPMMGHQPQVGEQMGFFVSAGDARGVGGVTSRRERSNVILVNLPAGDSGSF